MIPVAGFAGASAGMAGSGGQIGLGTAEGSAAASGAGLTGQEGTSSIGGGSSQSAGMAPIPSEEFSGLRAMMAQGAAMIRPSKGFETHMSVSKARKGHEVKITGTGC